MEIAYYPKYPSIEDLRNKAKKRIPRLAFEYLDGGCNQGINLKRNTADIRKLELKPWYLKDYKEASMRTKLFGHTYDAPFGMAPIGLQGLMWPSASEMLAAAAAPTSNYWQWERESSSRNVHDFTIGGAAIEF